jgi:hypothetical protein
MEDSPEHADDQRHLSDLHEGGSRGRRACAQLCRRHFSELVRWLYKERGSAWQVNGYSAGDIASLSDGVVIAHQRSRRVHA